MRKDENKKTDVEMRRKKMAWMNKETRVQIT